MRICYLETDARAFWTHRVHLARAVQTMGHEVHLIGPGGDAGGRFAAAGVIYHPLKLDRSGINPARETLAVAELARLFRRIAPDLIHNIALKSVLYGAVAARLAGVRAVVGSITGLGYVFIPGGAKRFILSHAVLGMLRVALADERSRVIVQNPDDFGFFVERRVFPAERCSIVFGSGVDVTRFAPRPEPTGEAVVLVGTRMLWDKGIGELVEATRTLRARGFGCRVLLAGDPDLENPATISPQQLQEWAAAGLVEPLGHSADVAALLARCTVACLPSYREGLPLFLAEAAAAGRASVTTDVPGCRSVVEHGRTGLLVPVRQSAGLADALARLLTRADERQAMARAARELAVTRFSKESVNNAIFDVYRAMRRDF